MNNQNKFYKVVTENNNSAIKEGTDISVKYIIDEWVYPKINQLMVFASKHDAISFYKLYSENSPMKIYECEVKNPSVNGFWCSEVLFKIYTRFLDLYSQKHRIIYQLLSDDDTINHRINNYGKMFNGTVFCDAVKLTKELSIK